jgi:hypothetical protein
MNGSLVSTVMGCLLILVGIGLVIFEIIKPRYPDDWLPRR